MTQRPGTGYARATALVLLMISILASARLATAPAGTTTAPPTPSFAITNSPEVTPSTGSTGAFPDAQSTGSKDGVVLTPRPGGIVDTPNVIIQNALVEGQLDVRASNVTIRNSKIVSAGLYGIKIDDKALNTVIEDVDVIGQQGYIGVAGAAYRATRLDVRGFEDGFLCGSNSTIEYTYVHGLAVGPTTHNDAIAIESGSGMVIRGNNLDWDRQQTSALNIATDYRGGTISDVTVEGNRFAGGTYSVYVRRSGGGEITRVVVRNNTWVRNSAVFGPYSIDTQITEWSANHYSDGAPVLL